MSVINKPGPKKTKLQEAPHSAPMCSGSDHEVSDDEEEENATIKQEIDPLKTDPLSIEGKFPACPTRGEIFQFVYSFRSTARLQFIP